MKRAETFGIDLGIYDRVHPLIETENGKIAARVLNEQIDFATANGTETAYTWQLEAAMKVDSKVILFPSVKWAQLEKCLRCNSFEKTAVLHYRVDDLQLWAKWLFD